MVCDAAWKRARVASLCERHVVERRYVRCDLRQTWHSMAFHHKIPKTPSPAKMLALFSSALSFQVGTPMLHTAVRAPVVDMSGALANDFVYNNYYPLSKTLGLKHGPEKWQITEKPDDTPPTGLEKSFVYGKPKPLSSGFAAKAVVVK